MATGRPARHPGSRPVAAHPRGEGIDPRAIVWQMADAGRGESRTPFATDALGSLAGLLVAKWAGYDEAERQAGAANDGRAFAPELAEALRRPAWERQAERHADAIVEALKNMAGRHAGVSPITRCLVNVAPLVISTAERHPSFVARLMEWVHQVEMGTATGRRAAAEVFDETLRGVSSRDGRQIGEYLTPAPVVDLMVELANPVPGERVYDPCFGFGGLLVRAAQRLHASARTDSATGWSDGQRTGIFGVEIDRASYAVGLCRTLLAGSEHPGLALGDALEHPLPDGRPNDGFDCVLTAPPWGLKVTRAYAGRGSSSGDAAAKPAGGGVSKGRFAFPSRDAENLFLQHAMGNLRPGGRAVVAVPEPTLYRSGSDRQVRKALLSSYCVDAVVSLPPGAFAPHANVTRESPALSASRAAPDRSLRGDLAQGLGQGGGGWERRPWTRRPSASSGGFGRA